MKGSKLPVAILGATGVVGQQYLAQLLHHPWFEPVFLAASARSRGLTLKGACAERPLHPKLESSDLLQLPIHDISQVEHCVQQCCLVFSALDTSTARDWEEIYAQNGLPVISNASAHRMTKDVPLLIPEINASHLRLIDVQRENRGWGKGLIVVKPNCTLQAYLLPLFAIHRHYPLDKVIVTTMQAASGAGYPGVASLDLIDNVIPYIAGEEEKIATESLRILGQFDGTEIIPAANIAISAHCNRVPVVDGHLATISFSVKGSVPSQDEIIDLWQTFCASPQQMRLPTAPQFPIVYQERENRPQPRLDRDNQNGMAITVGRLRPCSALHYRFTGLAHNTVRGAAGGGILNAELLVASGYIADTVQVVGVELK